MTEQQLHFDPETHIYTLHDAETPAAWGRRLLSVTQVLEAVRLVEDDWYTEQGRTRGRYVHRMVMYDERQGLDESTVDPRLRGYLDAYRAFKRDVGPGPCSWLEEPLADPVLGFAGTPDQLRLVHDRTTLLDLKSGGKHPAHPLQTAAYAHLLGEHNGAWRGVARAVLYLRKNGTYQLDPHTSRGDFKIFRAALTLAQWKERLAA